LTDVKPQEPLPQQEDLGPLPTLHGHPDPNLQNCMVQILLDAPMGWTDYGVDELKQVNDHLRAGSMTFAIMSRMAMYAVDFSDPGALTQTNASTKKCRQLRLVNDKTGVPLQIAPSKKKANPNAGAEQAPQYGQDRKADEQKTQNQKTGCCIVQ